MSNNTTRLNDTVTFGVTNVTATTIPVSALELWWNDYFFLVPILLSCLTFFCLLYYINVLRMNSQDYQHQQEISRRNVEASYARFCARENASKTIKERLRRLLPSLDALRSDQACTPSVAAGETAASLSSDGMSTTQTKSLSSQSSQVGAKGPPDELGPSFSVSSQL